MLTRLVTAVACSLAVAVVAVDGSGAQPRDSAPVSCAEVVGYGRPPAYRQPLPAAAVPAAFLPNVGSDPAAAPFTFWTKAGIVIRAGDSVTVAVAPNLAGVVRITWGGRSGTVIRFAACHTGATWNGYAGGFLARTPTVCVPLIVSAGRRHARVMFGLGKRCSR